ncbi:UNVERIFIED_CONTAM: hypothetical protein K2H54_001992 [Gekko kuhli]
MERKGGFGIVPTQQKCGRCIQPAHVPSGLAAPVKCTINQTQWKVSSQSIYLRWRSLGNPCNFNVTCSSHSALYRVCQPIQKPNGSYECDYNGLEAGTLYFLWIVSLSDGETSNITVQTDPLPPARFEIKKEKISTTTLQVWWSPSLGKVDRYELQLFDSTIKKIQEIHVPGGISRNEETFVNLIPGSKYTLSISAISGTKNSPTIDISGFTAPSPAENIQISVQMESVHVSWLPGVGNVDQYRLILLDKGRQLQQHELEKHVLSYNFSGLTPGHQYNLTIITRAGELENYNFRLIRTGETFYKLFSVAKLWQTLLT